MPMINGRFYSTFGRYSPYTSNLIHRYSMAAANDRAVAAANTLTGALSDSLTNLTQGMATIAGRRALDRIKAETAVKNAANASVLNTMA
jgi:hypothetical protein